MNSEDLRILHSENHIRVIEKEYNGAKITVANAVNAPMDLKIYGMTYQNIIDDYSSEIYPLSKIVLKCTNGIKVNNVKIPFVGYAVETSDSEKSNITIDGKHYIADYIEYDSKRNKAYSYKFIDETLLNPTFSLKDQLQAILTEPIVEEIIMENEEYYFKNFKSIQNKCEITLQEIGDNQFDFDEFVELGAYSGIEYVDLDNEKIYEYMGEEEYLYYKVNIPYDNDYEFSYKTTGLGSIVVRFYDVQKRNISSEIIDLIENGRYDSIQDGIIINSSKLNLLYKEGTNIDCFHLGFKVGEREYFSDLQLLKLKNKNAYMDLIIKTLRDIEFNFDEFVENGKYSGIEYVNAINETEKLYKYVGEEEYLYYKVFIPYNNNYLFFYKTTIIGDIVVRFYNKNKKNISSEIINIIEGGTYDSDQNGIIVHSTELIIPYKENTNISYFQVGFKVSENSYFSDLCLKKQ